MLVIKNISKAFGLKQVLDQICFSLAPGTITGLIGPSGGGKSVLLKIIGQVLDADSGEIDYGKIDDDMSCGKGIGLMFQEGALFDSINVFDNVAFPLVSGRVPSSLLDEKRKQSVSRTVTEMLDHVGLETAFAKLPNQISGGMRRRASLARAMVTRPALLLLDDPTSGLDPVASSIIMDLIVKLHREYRPTTLIISHDLRRLLPAVDWVMALYDGKIQFRGTLDDLRQCQYPFLRTFVSCRFDLGPLEATLR